MLILQAKEKNKIKYKYFGMHDFIMRKIDLQYQNFHLQSLYGYFNKKPQISLSSFQLSAYTNFPQIIYHAFDPHTQLDPMLMFLLSLI